MAVKVGDYQGAVDGGGYKASMDDPRKLPISLVPVGFFTHALAAIPEDADSRSLTETFMAWVDGGDDRLLHLVAMKLTAFLGSVGAVREVAAVLQYGAKKYAPNNWRRGMKFSEVASAALRHLLAVMGGEEIDPETGLKHLAHFGCNLAFLVEYTDHRHLYGSFDDRFQRPVPELLDAVDPF